MVDYVVNNFVIDVNLCGRVQSLIRHSNSKLSGATPIYLLRPEPNPRKHTSTVSTISTILMIKTARIYEQHRFHN